MKPITGVYLQAQHLLGRTETTFCPPRDLPPAFPEMSFSVSWVESLDRLHVRLRTETLADEAQHVRELVVPWEPLPVQRVLSRLPPGLWGPPEALLNMLCGLVGCECGGVVVPEMSNPAPIVAEA